jgi:hypothetical protein
VTRVTRVALVAKVALVTRATQSLRGLGCWNGIGCRLPMGAVWRILSMFKCWIGTDVERWVRAVGIGLTLGPIAGDHGI